MPLLALLRSFDNTTKREVDHETSTMGTVLRHHTGAVPRGYCGGADSGSGTQVMLTEDSHPITR